MRLKNIILLFLGFVSGISCKSARIYGGMDADIRNFPYMVTIRHYVSNGLLCSGSIVGRRHIITSAHCFSFNIPIILLRIFTGTTSPSSTTGLSYKIDHVDIHPAYKDIMHLPEVYRYDLAVVTTRKYIEYNEFQNKIALPVTSHRLGEVVLIAGWGKARDNGPVVNEVLQSAYTAVLDMGTCAASHPFIISYEQICVYLKPGVGMCMGDGGSPLVSNGVLVGVASFGVPCATGVSDIYTNVFHCIDFIRSIVPYERGGNKRFFMYEFSK